jgi:antitoxin HicB
MLAFPIDLTPDDNGTLLVRCPLLPIVVTFGETEEAARAHAIDAIRTALDSMIDDDEEIPLTSKTPPEPFVRLSLLVALKIELYRAVRSAGVTKVELARRLGADRRSVDDLLRLDRHSPLEQIEAAFAALGRHIDLTIREAA